MSQSDAHRVLIKAVAAAVEKRYPSITLYLDLQLFPGDELPPLIDGFRPDVYARDNQTELIVIAEAKTDKDIDRQHTYDQMISFMRYLERHQRGSLILAVTGVGANRAKTMLRFICKELNVKNTTIEVFDSCDFWQFDVDGGIKWHLI